MTRAPSRRLLAVLLVGVLALLLAAPGAPTTPAWAQEAPDDAPAVLVYSRTAGFRHLSIPDGIRTIRELGDAHGFAVEATEDPAVFTDASLARFDAVVFLNTTGDVVTDDGEAAFERYLRGGGGYVGVHAAADTEYEWDFYGTILGGAWFLAHPVQQPGVLVRESADHPSTAHLPERWALPLEEFYSFRANPREHVQVLLSIDESTYQQDPNTTHLPNSPTFPSGQSGEMGDHPMSWCHRIGAGRVWYSALGHESYLYQVPEYRRHLLGGIQTAAGMVEDTDCRVPGDAPAPSAGATAAPEPEATAGSGTGGGPTAEEVAAAASLPATGTTPLAVGLGALALLVALVLARGRASWPGRER